MAVRVRLFASLRDAAGSAEVEAAPGPLAAILGDLRRRYGEPFTSRLAVSSVLVDGDAVAGGAVAEVEVADGSEVVLLPPVSGGAGGGAPGGASCRSTGGATGPGGAGGGGRLLDCGTR